MENNSIRVEFKNYDTFTVKQGHVKNYEEFWEWLKEPFLRDNSNNEFVLDYNCKLFIKNRIEAFIETNDNQTIETERSKKFHNR